MNPSAHARNARHNLSLSFSSHGHDIELPVILLRGASPGQTLVVTAGVHGDEYEGVRAIFEITSQLDTAVMSGDLLCVPVCNPPAFWNVSRSSPLDNGNLARVFPGNSEGSPTEAIAWYIDRHILAHADFYIDLHSAGVRCLMPTMIGYESGDARAEAAANIFGAPVIWAHDTIPPGRTVSAARARGIPWLYTEARGAGRIHPDDLAVYRNGVCHLLQHLDILPGSPTPAAPTLRLHGDGNVDASITTSRKGFLIPEVDLLDTVTKGQTLGTLRGLYGEILETFTAPRDGVVALIHVCPLINSGDPLFLITGIRDQ